MWIKKNWWIIICIVLATITPVIVNYAFINLNLSTGIGLNNEHWLSFWGSYLGSLLGAIAALIALFLTLSQQKQLHEEVKEADRLRVLPALSCFYDISDFQTTPPCDCLIVSPDHQIICSPRLSSAKVVEFIENNSADSMFIKFTLKNIGMGPAFQISISIDQPGESSLYAYHIGGMASGDSRIYTLSFPKEEHFSFVLCFCDIFGNKYQSTSKIRYDENKDKYLLGTTTAPQLISPK